MEPAEKKPRIEGGGKDRFSELPNDLLGNILSRLPIKEAARAATLATRWRKVFGYVDSVFFAEEEGERFRVPADYYAKATEMKSASHALLNGINHALLGRRYSAGINVPLRCFGFEFDDFHRTWDVFHVDQWLLYVLRNCARELHLDLRFFIRRICLRDSPYLSASDTESDTDTFGDAGSDSDDDKKGLYPLPKEVFSCTVLRTLRLAHCRLNLPQNFVLPNVETLHLTGIRHDSGSSVQRLVSSCPALAYLTLEAVRHLTTFSVIQTPLRRFVLRCCHNAVTIQIDASRMSFFEYRGAAPSDALLTFHAFPQHGIPSVNIDLCTRVTDDPAQHASFTQLLQRFSNSSRLHIHHGRLHTACLAAPNAFPRLTRLVLQGGVVSHEFVNIIRGILEQSPALQVLVLDMSEERSERSQFRPATGGISAAVGVPGEAAFSLPCLRLQVKEIQLLHYNRSDVHRTLARLLLRNAAVLESLTVVFTRTRRASTDLKVELEGWAPAAIRRTFS